MQHRLVPFVLFVLFALTSVALGDSIRRLGFEDDQPGATPEAFELAGTKGAAPGQWVVVQDGANRVLAQTEAGPSARYGMAVLEGTSLADVRLSVRGKPVGGEVDRSVGLVWRWQGPDDYYVARTNVLEGNVRLYRVVRGMREKIASLDEQKLPDGWQTLEVEHRGARIRVLLDGKEVLAAEDATIPAAGRVGLWIKGDSVTYYDDLEVSALE